MWRPQSVAPTVAQHSPHPLQNRIQLSGPEDYRNLEALGNVCLQGIQKRGNLARDLLTKEQPQFAIITFTEVHHSSHYLWHKAQPENPVYANNGVAQLEATRPSVREIFRELDCQINQLIRPRVRMRGWLSSRCTGCGPRAGCPRFSMSGCAKKGSRRCRNGVTRNGANEPQRFSARQSAPCRSG